MLIAYASLDEKSMKVSRIKFSNDSAEVESLFHVETQRVDNPHSKVSLETLSISNDCKYVACTFATSTINQETVIWNVKGRHVEDTFPFDLNLSPNFKYGIIHEHGSYTHVRLSDVDVDRFKRNEKKDDAKKYPEREKTDAEHDRSDKTGTNRPRDSPENRRQTNLLLQGRKDRFSVFEG
jgi:hypothetical protein